MKYLTLLFSCLIIFNLPFTLANATDVKPLIMEQSVAENERLVNHQMENIRELLDPLMLEDEPKKEFEKMIPQIKTFSEVKKVGFMSNQFQVEFKNGSASYWDLPK